MKKAAGVTIVLVLIAVAVGVRVWQLRRNGGVDESEPTIPVAVRLELLQKKNTSLGHLENNDRLDEADQLFEEMIDVLPDDLFGHRNRVIGRLQALEKQPELIEDGYSALESLKAVAPEDAITWLLEARLADREGNVERQLSALRRATELDPDNASAWFELSQAALRTFDEPGRIESVAALRRAAELTPRNLYLLVFWLPAQAEAEDPAIRETIANARIAAAGVIEQIKRRNNIDLAVSFDEMETALDQGDWTTVLARARLIGNLLRPEEISASDRLRISENPLAWVVVDFNDEFERADLPTEPTIPDDAGTISFVESVLLRRGLVDLDGAGLRAIEVGDFDLLTTTPAPTEAELRSRRFELVTLDDGTVTIYRNSDDGWSVLDQSAVIEGATGMLLGTLGAGLDSKDFDATLDILVYGDSGAQVIVVNPTEDQTETQISLTPIASSLSGLSDVTAVNRAATADLDGDGDIDLVFATDNGIRLFSNAGGLRFESIDNRSQLNDVRGVINEIIPIDWDRDLDIDLMMVGPETAGYLENLRYGEFGWRRFEPDVSGRLSESNASAAAVDTDANGSWDLVATGATGLQVLPTTRPAEGVIQFREGSNPGGQASSGLKVLDWNNDGDLDVLSFGTNGIEGWQGTDQASFAAVNLIDSSLANREVIDLAVLDVDQDGDQDLIVLDAEGLHVLSNEGGNEGNWIDIRLLAAASVSDATKRINAFGRGAVLELRAGSIYLPRFVDSQSTHFGLGNLKEVDVIRVIWPNGIPRNVISPTPNQIITEEEQLIGSCPYLFSWDGTQFSFVTDLLWAAPLGLQQSETEYAPSRPWEFLKIPAQLLQPKDGRYDLRITEELWEVAYFDQVELIAVDHPSEFEIETNEKVGPPSIAEFRILTVRDPIRPQAAFDATGADVLALVSERDERYMPPNTRRLSQGLFEEHFLELDFGLIPADAPVMLYLTGWVYPTDTSLNVAISQDRNLPAPRPPSIQVPGRDGGWVETIPYTGFPGGKTKTIAVDLTGVLKPDDSRFRIVTNMDFRWDQAVLTLDEEPLPLEMRTLELISADLRSRGFSTRTPQNDGSYGPEDFDYQRLDPTVEWPPIRGRFTRFGDVRDLIESADDRLVVMGAGDEIALSFAAPPKGVRDGWTRDFIIHNRGWDKDANLNTIYGRTVEPLPFGSMKGYPFTLEDYQRGIPLVDEVRDRRDRRQSNQGFWERIRLLPESE